MSRDYFKLPAIFHQVGKVDVSPMGKLKQNQCIPIEDVFKQLDDRLFFPFNVVEVEMEGYPNW